MKILNELLDSLNEHKGRFLFDWLFQGRLVDGWCLAGHTFIIVAGVFNGVPKAFRFPGAVEKSSQGDRIRFSDDAMRVSEGSRAGVTVPLGDLNEHEVSQKAGLRKLLCEGGSASLSMNRKGDILFLDCLTTLAKMAESSDSAMIPESVIIPKEASCIHTRNGSTASLKPLFKKGIRLPYEDYYGPGKVLMKAQPPSPKWLRGEDSILPTKAAYVSFTEYAKEF